MNAAKMTLVSTVVAVALGLGLGLMSTPAAAKPNCDDPPCGGGKPDSESSGKVFPVKVTFDNDWFDSIKSDGGPYIDGQAVRAEVPVEGSPPGQFIMVLSDADTRFLFIDFGLAEDCEGAALDTLGCVRDDSGASGELVLCPFLADEREDNTGNEDVGLCSGFKQVWLTFRHAFVDDDTEEFMLGMPNGITLLGESKFFEFSFSAEKNSGDWRLRFDELCLGGEFLEITATDNDKTDALPNDEWQLGTGAGTKTACLTKTGKRKAEDLIERSRGRPLALRISESSCSAFRAS